jgi:hypothetical protein
VGLVCFCIWNATRPTLEWYVSGPVGADGQRARILIPAVWKLNQEVSRESSTKNPDSGVKIVYLEPGESPLPLWFRRVLRLSTNDQSHIHMFLAPISFGEDAPEDSRVTAIKSSQGSFFASRTIHDRNARLFGVAVVMSSNRAVVERLHTSVLTSFRIE